MSAAPARVIDRAWIAARIPHQGSMCLLDGVESWDDNAIVCVSRSHLSPENPLRADARLGIANAIEYAAQAMAVHCALLIEAKIEAGDSVDKPQAGYLTSVRDVRWQRPRFDDVAGDLKISASRISGNDVTVLYSFALHADALLLAEGRAGVVLNAAGV